MDVKEAVAVAKNYVQELFVGEHLSLEEVWFDDAKKNWCVTIGFRRERLANQGAISEWSNALGGRYQMHYKTVRVFDKTGKVVSVKNHEKMPIAP
jgi:hypothetical protein